MAGMMAHPVIFFDNTPRKKDSMWKKIGAFLLKWAPGLIEAIMMQKAKEAAAQAAGKPPKS